MTNEPDKSGKKDIAPRYSDPFSALRAEVDSLFDSFMGGLPAVLWHVWHQRRAEAFHSRLTWT